MGAGGQSTIELATQQAENRSQLFRLFAVAFSHPSDDFLDDVISGGFLDTLKDLGDGLPYPTPFANAAMSPLPNGVTKKDIKVFFTTCFESGSQAVSLRESAYSTLTEKALLENVLRFYQHFGLELSTGALRELPDSLPVELEFLHYLAFLEAGTRSASGDTHNTAALQAGQRDFITRHLGTWARPFMLRLKSVPDNGFYADLADLMATFVEAEQRFNQQAPAPGR